MIVKFLNSFRIQGIVYDEICWDENNDDFIVKPNIRFQNWVKEMFDVEIPKTALEIVKRIDDENSEDEFFNWYHL